MKHPGFKNAAADIERTEKVGKASAGAILASATRRAGKKARKKNPRLNRVKGSSFYGD